MEINKFKILIHGGAGTISGPPSGREPYVQVLKRIIANSYSFAKGLSESYGRHSNSY